MMLQKDLTGESLAKEISTLVASPDDIESMEQAKEACES